MAKMREGHPRRTRVRLILSVALALAAHQHQAISSPMSTLAGQVGRPRLCFASLNGAVDRVLRASHPRLINRGTRAGGCDVTTVHVRAAARQLRMGPGRNGRDSTEPEAGRVQSFFRVSRVSRRSAIGGVLLSGVMLLPPGDYKVTSASGAPMSSVAESRGVAIASKAASDAKDGADKKSVLQNIAETAINITAGPPKTEAEITAKKAREAEAKAKSEADSVSTQLRKDLVQIQKELEDDRKALETGIEARLKQISKQLEDGNGNDVLPFDAGDLEMFERRMRSQAKASGDVVDSKVARIEARISELDFEIKKKKIMEEYERKQQELGKRLRNAAKKLNDAELKEKLLFEADLLEKKAGNRQLSARDQLKRAQYTLQQRLEEQLEPLLVNNTDKLLKLEDKVPLLKGRLYKKEIKDDAEYVTFPLFGGMIVEKQKLNVAQVAVGGVFAGAFGEVIKDAISFPVDTVRTRLMTAGSFRDPTPADTSDSASAPRVDQKGSQWEARREELTFGTRREVLAAKRQQLAGERGGRDRGVESEGEQVRLGAKLPVPLDLGARLMIYKEDIERGTTTFVRNTSKQARTAIVAWGRRRWYEALVRVRASPDWQRLRQLRAELQEDRRWLAAERGIATTVAVTSTIIRRATVPLQQRLQRFSAPVGIFNDVYRGVAPVLLASPFQGALFFGVKDTIKKGLPMLGANPELTFIAGVVVADSAYWLVRCPAETVKTRVQTGVDQNMVQSIKKILQTEGLYGFYRGYLPLLQLDFPFAAVQLALFSTYIGLVPAVFGHDAAMLDQFVGGFVCSAFTAAVTCPLSVASTRILLDAGGGAKNAGQVEVDIVKDLGELESRLAEKAADDFGKAKEAVVNVEKGIESAFESATSAPRTGTRTIEQEGGQTEAEGESEQPTEDGDEPGLFLPGPVQVKAGEGTQIVSRMPPQSPLPTNTAALAGDSGEETDKAAGKTTHRQQRDVPPPPPLPPLQQGKPEGGRGKLDASIEERALLYQWRRQRRGGAQKTPRAEGGLSEDESTKTLLRRAAQPATAVPAKGAEGPRKGWDRQPKYKNMLQTIKLIATEEGVGALFKGLVPRVLQLGLNHAIRFTGYQSTRNVLVEDMMGQNSLLKLLYGSLFQRG